jgi:excisionase family DNA binding protein
MENKILYSRKETSAILSISLRTLDGLIATKELPARRIGKRTLISADALKAFSRRDHPTQPAREDQ